MRVCTDSKVKTHGFFKIGKLLNLVLDMEL